MTTTGNGGPGTAGPLDTERAKLRLAGYTDAEVSQILIARAVGNPAGASGQGVFSNAVASAVAIGTHARSLVPTFRSDFAIILGGGAPFGARLGSFIAVVLKAAVIGALSYAAWQEWQQHIISATAIAEAEVGKRRAEECEAKAKAVQAVTPTVYTWVAFEKLAKDCSPTYDPKHYEVSTKPVSALLREGPPQLEASFASISAAPDFLELRDRARRLASSGQLDKAMALVKTVADLTDARRRLVLAAKDGQYDKALEMANVLVAKISVPDFYDPKSQSEQLTQALINVAWYSLLTRQFGASLAASERARQIDPSNLRVDSNRAHAEMLLRHDSAARSIYMDHRTQMVDEKTTWEAQVLADFDALRKAGLASPLMADVAMKLTSNLQK